MSTSYMSSDGDDDRGGYAGLIDLLGVIKDICPTHKVPILERLLFRCKYFSTFNDKQVDNLLKDGYEFCDAIFNAQETL